MKKPLLFLALTLPLFSQTKTLTVPERALAQAAAYGGMQPGIAENYVSLPGMSISESSTQARISIEPVSAPIRHEAWSEYKTGIVAKFRWPAKDLWLGVQAASGRLGKEASFVLDWRFKFKRREQ